MNILLVSKSWPLYEKSGVGACAWLHACMLAELSHSVVCVGAVENPSSVITLNSGVTLFYESVSASGSGALYSPVRINRTEIDRIILAYSPKLIIVEGWQSSLTDEFILSGRQSQVPILVISHGISILPHSFHPFHLFRFLAWLPYGFFKFPRLLASINMLTTLSNHSRSARFLDRMLYRFFYNPPILLTNTAYNVDSLLHPRERKARKQAIVCIGYYGHIKRQLMALNVIRLMRTSVELIFIGPRKGPYFKAVKAKSHLLNSSKKVFFCEDTECSIPEMISSSMALLITSLTEVMPVVALEAMAAGTPIVSTPVGAMTDIRGALLANSCEPLAGFLDEIFMSPDLWSELSELLFRQYRESYTYPIVKRQLKSAVDLASRKCASR